MATVRHVTSGAGRTKFQTAWFLLNKVYIRNVYCRMLHERKKVKKPKLKNQQVLQNVQKRFIKASTIQYTPNCGRDTEVCDDCAFILQLIILKSYLTCHRLSIHMWTVFAPVSVRYPLLYTLSSGTIFSVQRCTPNHWWRFPVFENVHRFTGHIFSIQSCTLFHLSWFLNHFSTHGFQYRQLNTHSPVMVYRIHDCILSCQ
jgi:hypothetical protein